MENFKKSVLDEITKLEEACHQAKKRIEPLETKEEFTGLIEDVVGYDDFFDKQTPGDYSKSEIFIINSSLKKIEKNDFFENIAEEISQKKLSSMFSGLLGVDEKEVSDAFDRMFSSKN